MFIPTSFQEDITEWHHQNLKHPGGDRMYLTMKETFYWKGMKNYIKEHVKRAQLANCAKCQGIIKES